MLKLTEVYIQTANEKIFGHSEEALKTLLGLPLLYVDWLWSPSLFILSYIKFSFTEYQDFSVSLLWLYHPHTSSLQNLCPSQTLVI